MRTISLTIPGSKSITNRALILAAIKHQTTTLIGALESDDTKHMIAGLKKLGVGITKKGSTITVKGGLKKIYTKPLTFFCGNSGTTIRFLAALVATCTGSFTLDGEARMRERPIKDLGDALTSCGATVEYLNLEGFPPLRITGPITKKTCMVRGDVSSQFISGLLLAAQNVEKGLTIKIRGTTVSKPYIELTKAIISSFKSPYSIEPDASSASYFWGISQLTHIPIDIENISPDSMQPDIQVVAAMQRAKDSKKGGAIHCINFPDAAMTLACICAVSKGTWKLTGLQTLRDKECDRLSALETELRKIGCRVKAGKDFLKIVGGVDYRSTASIKTYNDHRMAMCFGMLKTIIPGLSIKDPGCVSKTFPTFWTTLANVTKVSNERNIVLVGMRGCGKTSLAQGLGKKLSRTVFDSDHEIEKKVGMPIKDFVAQKGWKEFRKIEHKILTKLSQKKNAVIATGGGAILDPRNIQNLRRNSLCIYISCSLKELQRRLAGDPKRPTLTQNQSVIQELPQLLKEREPLYQGCADEVIDVSKRYATKRGEIEAKVQNLVTLVNSCGIS